MATENPKVTAGYNPKHGVERRVFPAEPYGVYIHLPWCRTRCPYCAFNVAVDVDAPFDAYTDALCAQWDELRGSFTGPPRSVYFGGGTPSLCPSHHVARLLEAVGSTAQTEVTLEANPGTVNAEALTAFHQAGVNRLSLGIQTFNPRFAHLLNRGHTVRQSQELVEIVRGIGFASWSVDVIFHLPGQSLLDFQLDLEAILAAAPPHVSLYALTFEEGTPFERASQLGRIMPSDEDTWLNQYTEAVGALGLAGLHRYEVSNFARPGHESVHNSLTWRGGHYAGLGAGAHGFLPLGHRTVMQPDINAYLADPTGYVSFTLPTPEQAATDLILSTIRHREGLPLDRLRAMGFLIPQNVTRPLFAAGMLQASPDRLMLGPTGWTVADGITRRLCNGLEKSITG